MMSCIRTACAVLVMAGAAFSQEGLVARLGWWNGLEIRFVTKIEPPGTMIPGGVVVEGGRVHRIIEDRTHKQVLGYEVQLDPAEGGKAARLRIQPFRPTDSKISFEPGYTFLELPRYPVVPNLRLGDTVALDLLVNAATGQKVVDYLTLSGRGNIPDEREARDLSLADVELEVMDPQVTVNEKPGPSLVGGGFSGAVVWMYLPGHGRFVFSLTPHADFGFIKSGVVSANSMLIHAGPVEVHIDCSRRIAPASGVYNLYIAHEPDWRPPAPRFPTMGSADRPEYVFGKK
jgi:hypothetical protein